MAICRKSKYSITPTVFFIFAIFLFFTNSLITFAVWQTPSSKAPAGPVPPPAVTIEGAFIPGDLLRNSDNTQEKIGSLEILGEFISGTFTPSVTQGWRARFIGNVGIGDYFIDHEPGGSAVVLDVAGNASANCFKLRDPSTGQPVTGSSCFTFNQSGTTDLKGPTGDQGPRGATGTPSFIQGDNGDKGSTGSRGDKGPIGPGGDKGAVGPQGSMGVNVVDTSGLYLQTISSGRGIFFKKKVDPTGPNISSIGKGGQTVSGIIGRDFSATYCEFGINSIDPNGISTCASANGNGSNQTVAMTDIVSGDSYADSILISQNPNTGAFNLRVDGAVIQGTVIKGCGQGQAISRIKGTGNSGYQDVDIECTPAGASAAGYCAMEGRTFYCVEANGTRTSIDIPSRVTPKCDYAPPPDGCGYIQGSNYDPITSCGLELVCTGALDGPTVDLKVNNSDGPLNNIPSGSSINLSWSSTGATSCTASGDWSGPKNPPSGSESKNVTQSQTFTLTCTGSGGMASDSVTVNITAVTPPPPPPTPTNNYAYITSLVDNALEIVDISNPSSPIHVGKIKDGDVSSAGSAMLKEPYSVAVSGKYAYVASRGSNALEIIDISNPANPVHAASVKSTSQKPHSTLYGPVSVSISGNHAYVLSGMGSALETIDISNPTSPIEVGSVVAMDTSLSYIDNTKSNIAALFSDVRSLFVLGNYAYVSSGGFVGDVYRYCSRTTPHPIVNLDFDGLYGYNGGLSVVDISNPVSPKEVGGLYNSSAIFEDELVKKSTDAVLSQPWSVYVSGNYAYVVASGLSSGTFAGGNALTIIDISNPALPSYRGKLLFNNSSRKSVFVSGRYAYVTMAESNMLEIIDISNPANPVRVGGISVSSPYGVSVSGNYAYVTASGNQSLEVIDISSPTSPVSRGRISNGSGGAALTAPFSIFIVGNVPVYSGPINPTPVPAPSGPPTVVEGNGQVSITSWPAVSGAVKYKLYWNVDNFTTPIVDNITNIPTATSPLIISGPVGSSSIFNIFSWIKARMLGAVVAGFTNGTSYTFKVSAVDSTGKEGNKSSATPAVKAQPPLVADTVAPPVVAVTNGQVTITGWPTVTGAKSYKVYKSTDNFTTPVADNITTIPTATNPLPVSGITSATSFKLSAVSYNGVEYKSAAPSSSVTPTKGPTINSLSYNSGFGTMNWSSTGATACWATSQNPYWFGYRSDSGGKGDFTIIQSLTRSTNFKIECENQDGMNEKQVNVEVPVKPADIWVDYLRYNYPVRYITSNPIKIDWNAHHASFNFIKASDRGRYLSDETITVNNGDSVDIKWSARDATSCSISGLSGAQGTSGSITVSNLNQSQTYFLNCSVAGKIETDFIRVNVRAPFSNIPQPTGVSVQARTNPKGTVISWKEIPGVDGYYIYRNGGPAGSFSGFKTSYDNRTAVVKPGTLSTISVSDTQYTLNTNPDGLPTGSYCYKVTAYYEVNFNDVLESPAPDLGICAGVK
jgi:hypothetical protein